MAKTAEQRLADKKQRDEDKRKEIEDRLANAISSKHVHVVAGTTTVTLEKELKGRLRAMMWRCKCGAKYDGEYWYKREDN